MRNEKTTEYEVRTTDTKELVITCKTLEHARDYSGDCPEFTIIKRKRV